MLTSVPPVTRALIIVCVAMFGIELAVGGELIAYLALWPIGTPPAYTGALGFQPWQVITYGFLHSGFGHLAFNMLALYMFGKDIEQAIGSQRFFNLYFVSVIAAGITQLVFAAVAGGAPYPTVGASGGVFGVLLAFAVFFPRRIIMLLIPPIPMPARVLVLIYGLLELYLGVTGTQQGVAHFAHLGGMLGAWLLITYWRSLPPARRG
jgi:membrane associated rhomboid family serine protease